MTCKKENCCSDPGESKQREPGIYWVKRFDEWNIAYFNGESWVSIQYEDEPIRDRDWQEIDERRIERQPVCKDKSLGFVSMILKDK